MKRIIFALAATVSLTCHAEYIRTGPMMATVCKGFFINFCAPTEVKALEKDGKFYEPGRSFEAVHEYRKNKCHINLDSSNVATKIVRGIKNPNFYTEEDGKLAKINPDYLSFPCVER